MRIPSRLLPHKVIVEPLLGEGARGRSYGPAVEWARVYVEDKRTTQRSPGGEDTYSDSFFVTDPERILPEGSFVTIWPGTPRERRTEVMSQKFVDMPRLPSNVTFYLH